jgi:hypothetical protein
MQYPVLKELNPEFEFEYTYLKFSHDSGSPVGHDFYFIADKNVLLTSLSRQINNSIKVELDISTPLIPKSTI